MHYKNFLVGALCGLLVCVVAYHLVMDSRGFREDVDVGDDRVAVSGEVDWGDGSHNGRGFSIDNMGDARMEGHTPTTFRGAGTGLFIGDNLHGDFPHDAGLQAFVTFDLSRVSRGGGFDHVELFSSFAQVDGDPLENLGKVMVDVVSYDRFSPDLWDVSADGEACVFAPQSDETFSCDVTGVVKEAVLSGSDRLSFRLKFEKATDGDGQQDLLSFRHYDPNANIAGLFQLIFDGGMADDLDEGERVVLPVRLHRVVDSGLFTTSRSPRNATDRFRLGAEMWGSVGVDFDVEIVDTVLSESQIVGLESGDVNVLSSFSLDEPAYIHGFFLGSFDRVNGIAFSGRSFAVVDDTSVRDYRTIAHEIGHLLGLSHTQDSIGRLMFQGSDGHMISDQERGSAHRRAREWNLAQDA